MFQSFAPIPLPLKLSTRSISVQVLNSFSRSCPPASSSPVVQKLSSPTDTLMYLGLPSSSLAFCSSSVGSLPRLMSKPYRWNSLKPRVCPMPMVLRPALVPPVIIKAFSPVPSIPPLTASEKACHPMILAPFSCSRSTTEGSVMEATKKLVLGLMFSKRVLLTIP